MLVKVCCGSQLNSWITIRQCETHYCKSWSLELLRQLRWHRLVQSKNSLSWKKPKMSNFWLQRGSPKKSDHMSEKVLHSLLELQQLKCLAWCTPGYGCFPGFLGILFPYVQPAVNQDLQMPFSRAALQHLILQFVCIARVAPLQAQNTILQRHSEAHSVISQQKSTAIYKRGDCPQRF